LIRASNRELLVFLPTVNTFYRYEREDIIRAFKEEAEHGIKVRILMQRTKDGTVRNRGILRDRDEIVQELIKNPLIVVQYLDKFLDIKLITIISDTKFALAIKIKNDDQEKSKEAVKFATYTNRESAITSYTSRFETLWMQAEFNRGK
jgi:hypothetical protein